jgi:hypothetical protein
MRKTPACVGKEICHPAVSLVALPSWAVALEDCAYVAVGFDSTMQE